MARKNGRYFDAVCRDCVFCRKLLKIGKVPSAVCTINLRYKNASYESDFIAKEIWTTKMACTEFKPNQNYKEIHRRGHIIDAEYEDEYEEKSLDTI